MRSRQHNWLGATIRPLALCMALIAMTACSETAPTTALNVDPTEIYAARVSGATEPLHISEIRVNRVNDQQIDASVTFSAPVDPFSTVGQLTLRPVIGSPEDGSPAMGTPIEPDPEVAPIWSPDNRFVVLRYRVGSTLPHVLSGQSTIKDIAGRGLDGAVARPDWIAAGDPSNRARFSDDGYAGPSTYHSLPILPDGDNELDSHPFLPLNNARPQIRIGISGAGAPVTTSTTALTDPAQWPGTVSADSVFVIELDDLNDAPLFNGESHRKRRRLWRPDTVAKSITLVDANGRPVPMVLALDTDGKVNYGLETRIQSFLSPTQLTIDQVVAWDVANEKRKAAIWDTKSRSVDLSYDVAGLNGTTLTLPSVVYEGYGYAYLGNQLRIYDPEAAWIRDEWQGHSILRDTQAGQLRLEVKNNRATVLDVSAHAGCGQDGCSYRIVPEIDLISDVGNVLQWLGEWVVVVPQEPLTPGEYTLQIIGGDDGLRDIYGLPMFDGVRDGDEIAGRPDDVLSVTFSVVAD